MEEVPPDRGDVGEDADTEDDDDTGRQLRADSELVPEEDDERRHDDVGEEGDDEDLVVEDAVEHRPDSAEDRVEGGDDRDRQVGLEPEGHVRVDEEPDADTGEEADEGDHCAAFPLVTGRDSRTVRLVAPGRRTSSLSAVAVTM